MGHYVPRFSAELGCIVALVGVACRVELAVCVCVCVCVWYDWIDAYTEQCGPRRVWWSGGGRAHRIALIEWVSTCTLVCSVWHNGNGHTASSTMKPPFWVRAMFGGCIPSVERDLDGVDGFCGPGSAVQALTAITEVL